MKSRIAQETAHDNARRMTEREHGVAPTGLRLTASRAAHLQVAVGSRLPVEPNEGTKLQNDDGSFVFLAGYSAVGGPDVAG